MNPALDVLILDQIFLEIWKILEKKIGKNLEILENLRTLFGNLVSLLIPGLSVEPLLVPV
jgi:hypothetical protein